MLLTNIVVILLEISIWHFNSSIWQDPTTITNTTQIEKYDIWLQYILDSYSFVILILMIKLCIELNVVQRFREMMYNLGNMARALSTAILLILLVDLCLTHMFLFGTSEFKENTEIGKEYYKWILLTWDMMFAHFSPLYGTFAADNYNIFFFFVMSFVMKLVLMNFILALATTILKGGMSKVPVNECSIKLDWVLESMERKRLMACKKKRTTPHIHDILDKKENTATTLNLETDADQYVCDNEVEHKNHCNLKKDTNLKDYYIIIEKSDEINLAGADKEKIWKNQTDQKLTDLEMRFKVVEDITKKDDNIHSKMAKIMSKL